MKERPELSDLDLAQHAINRAFDYLKDAHRELGEAGYRIRKAKREEKDEKPSGS